MLVGDNDVLIGRQGFCRENGGNKFLAALVENVFNEHEAADARSDMWDRGQKRSKEVIKHEIVETIKANGGRFLKVNTTSREWEEAGRLAEMKKVVDEFKRQRKNKAAARRVSGCAQKLVRCEKKSYTPIIDIDEVHGGIGPRSGEQYGQRTGGGRTGGGRIGESIARFDVLGLDHEHDMCDGCAPEKQTDQITSTSGNTRKLMSAEGKTDEFERGHSVKEHKRSCDALRTRDTLVLKRARVDTAPLAMGRFDVKLDGAEIPLSLEASAVEASGSIPDTMTQTRTFQNGNSASGTLGPIQRISAAPSGEQGLEEAPSSRSDCQKPLQPTKQDYLVGKEYFCLENTGNALLREMIDQFAEEWERLPTGSKRRKAIKLHILSEVTKKGGRFLRRRAEDGDRRSKPSGIDKLVWKEMSGAGAQTIVADGFARRKKAGRKKMKVFPKISSPLLCPTIPDLGESVVRAASPKSIQGALLEPEAPALNADAHPLSRKFACPKPMAEGMSTPDRPSGDDGLKFSQVFAVLGIRVSGIGPDKIISSFEDSFAGLRDLMAFSDLDFSRTLKRAGFSHVDRVRLRDFRLWFQTQYISTSCKPKFTEETWFSFREAMNAANMAPPSPLRTDSGLQPSEIEQSRSCSACSHKHVTNSNNCAMCGKQRTTSVCVGYGGCRVKERENNIKPLNLFYEQGSGQLPSLSAAAPAGGKQTANMHRDHGLVPANLPHPSEEERIHNGDAAASQRSASPQKRWFIQKQRHGDDDLSISSTDLSLNDVVADESSLSSSKVYRALAADVETDKLEAATTTGQLLSHHTRFPSASAMEDDAVMASLKVSAGHQCGALSTPPVATPKLPTKMEARRKQGFTVDSAINFQSGQIDETVAALEESPIADLSSLSLTSLVDKSSKSAKAGDSRLSIKATESLSRQFPASEIDVESSSGNVSSLSSSRGKSRISALRTRGGHGVPRSAKESLICANDGSDLNDDDTSILTAVTTNYRWDTITIRSILNEMQAGLSDAELVVWCCGDMNNLLWERGGFIRRSRLCETIEVMFEALRTHSDHTTVPRAVINVIERLCSKEKSPNATQRIPILLDTLSRHRQHPRVLIHGFFLLWKLSATCDNRVSIELSGGIGLVLQSMKRHLNNKMLQIHGCLLLSSVAENECCRQTLVADKGIPLVLLSLLKHSVGSNIFEQGRFALCRLACVEVDGGLFLHTVVKWMQQSFQTSSYGRRIPKLLKLVSDDPTERQLAACVLMGWTQLHESNTEVLEHGYTALASLMYCPSALEWLTVSKVIPDVVSAMQGFLLDVGVQTAGCLMLARLAEGEGGRKEIVVCGGISAVLSALEQHPNAECHVFAHGKVALCRLARAGCGADSFVAVIVSWMRDQTRPSQESYSNHGFPALLKSARKDLGKCRLIACVIVGWIQKHGGCHEVQLGFVEVLANLPDDEVICYLIATSLVVIAAVIVTMQRHASNSDVVANACMSLAKAVQGDGCHEAIIAANGGLVVVEAMQNHSTDARVQESGCRALWKLAGNLSMCQNIVSVGGIPVVGGAMKLHSSHKGIQEYGRLALKCLVEGASSGQRKPLGCNSPLSSKRYSEGQTETHAGTRLLKHTQQNREEASDWRACRGRLRCVHQRILRRACKNSINVTTIRTRPEQ